MKNTPKVPTVLQTKTATLFVPDFLTKYREELRVLLHVLHDPLVTHVYELLLAHCDLKTGEYQGGGYHRLIELSTPPQPERGRRRVGPTMKQMRDAVDDLVHHGLVRRDAKNSAQGTLRLWLTPRLRPELPVPLKEPIKTKTIKALQLGSMRVVPSPMDDLDDTTSASAAVAPPQTAPAPAPASKSVKDAALRKYYESIGTSMEEVNAKKAKKPKKTPVPGAPAGAVAGASSFASIGALL